MSDLCRVLVVGNLSRDLERQLRPDGVAYGTTSICAGRTMLVDGVPVTETVSIPVEIIGAARVASAMQFGAGSRVLIEGHLEAREELRTECHRRADGAGGVLVRVPRQVLVLVVDTIFNTGTPLPASDAQRQPAQVYWQDAT